MSDTPKRPMDENDAIKKMLDRLRKTVIEAPADEEEQTAVAAADVTPPVSTEGFLSMDEDDVADSSPSVSLDVEEDADDEDVEILDISDTVEDSVEIAAVKPEAAEAAPLDDASEVEDAPDTPAVTEVAPPTVADEVAKDSEDFDTADEAGEAPVCANAFDDDDFLEDEEEEDAIDEGVISQFFTLGEEEEENVYTVPSDEPVIAIATDLPLAPEEEEEEELPDVSTDDFLSALAWEGELATQEEKTPLTPADTEVPDAPQVEEAAAAAETVEIDSAEETAKEEKKTDPARDPISFFSPAATPKHAAYPPASPNTQITESEAQDLFAAKRPASYGTPRPYYLASEEGQAPAPVLDTTTFATEENGYAVEVAVNTVDPFAPAKEEKAESAPAPAPAASVEEEAPVDLVDDADYADEQDDAFLNLLGKLNPQNEPEVKKPQPKKDVATPFGRQSAGEQLSMDIFTAPAREEEEEEPVIPVAPVEKTAPAPTVAAPAPAVEVSVAPTVDAPVQDREEPVEEAPAPEPVSVKKDAFFGEMPLAATEPDIPAPARPAHRPLPFDAEKELSLDIQEEEAASEEEPLEVELPPDENARPVVMPPAPKKHSGRSFFATLKAFFARLAPAAGEADAMRGLYTEEAAAYNEYSSRNQIALFARKFVSEGSLCTLRIILIAFLSTFLLVLENFELLGYTPAGVLASRDVQIALHLFSMLLVLIASIPLFSRAWRALFARRVTADLYPVILILLSVVYDLLLYLLAPAHFRFFGLIAAIFALFAAIADQRKVKADFAAFRLLSSSGDKLACSVAKGASTAAEEAAVADLPEGEQSRIVSLKKVAFAGGFFHRITRNCEDSYQNTVLLAVAFLLSLGVSLAVGILTSSFLFGFYAFALAFSLVLPAVLPLLHKIPAAILSLSAASHHTAVVGEVSALEYSDVAAMTFEDVLAFPAKNMRIQRIKLYNDSALDRVLYQVAGLFSAVGGPLDSVFRASTAELGVSEDVTLLRVDQGGLLALVDGYEISVGSGEYMLDNAVHVFYDPEDERLLAGGKTSVMFAAEGGVLVAKFYIRYKMDAGFEKQVEALNKRGIRTLLRSFDPNITDELVDKISYTGDHGLRVIRKTVDQRGDLAAPQINSGIVTKTDSKDLIRTLFSCRRVVRLIRAGGIASYVLGGIGGAAAITLAVLSLLGTVPSVFFVGYHLFVSLLFLLVSKITV